MKTFQALHRASQGLIDGVVIANLLALTLFSDTHLLAWGGATLPWLLVLNLWARNHLLQRQLSEAHST